METEELQTIESKQSIALYQNASTLVILPEEEKKLDEPIDELDIEIRPDGLIYPPQVFWRNKLNQTFGRGQWALIKHKSTKDPDKDKVYYDGSLLVRNCFVARATGEAEYHLENPMQSWASVEESAKSDCLGRCCKDLGIFKELWQPNFVRNWIKKYAVKVFIKVKKNGQEQTKVSWRRIDSDPLWNEVSICPDSPNFPKTKKQTEVRNTKAQEIFEPSEEINDKINHAKSVDELMGIYNAIPKDQQHLYLEKLSIRKGILKAKNYTETARRAITKKELDIWFSSLTEEEKKKAGGVYKNRMEEIKEYDKMGKPLEV